MRVFRAGHLTRELIGRPAAFPFSGVNLHTAHLL